MGRQKKNESTEQTLGLEDVDKNELADMLKPQQPAPHNNNNNNNGGNSERIQVMEADGEDYIIKNGKKVKLVNCLQNRKVRVQFMPQRSRVPKGHALYGNMSERSIRKFCVPVMQNGQLVNILTNDEKNYLEYILQLPENALSIYKAQDNFWKSPRYYDVTNVQLSKHTTTFDLSDPYDYIRYKILKANKNEICPSLEDYEKRPLATYQFIIIENDEDLRASYNRTNTMQNCFIKYGEYKSNYQVLKLVIEELESKKYSNDTNITVFQSKAGELIQKMPKTFLSAISDKYITQKVLINEAIDRGIIGFRGDQYYYLETNTPLCDYGQIATRQNAAMYLASPKNQELFFLIQGKLNTKE